MRRPCFRGRGFRGAERARAIRVTLYAPMYQLMLILKYLVRKIAPLIAAIAVCLCTAMVICVISVMGGFLDMLEISIQRTTGDVIITRGLTGFPYYDQLIAEIDKLPQAEAATPVIESYALLSVGDQAIPVKVVGIRPASYEKVTPWRRNLVWSEQDVIDKIRQRQNRPDFPPELRADYDAQVEQLKKIDIKQFGETMTVPTNWQTDPQHPLAAAVIGIEVNPYHIRDARGQYDLDNSLVFPNHWPTTRQVKLTTVPLNTRGSVDKLSPKSRNFITVNEYKSGHYEIDSMTVFVPFDVIQKMLDMEGYKGYPQYDDVTGRPVGEAVDVPPQTTHILVRAAVDSATGQRYSAEALQEAVDGAIDRVRARVPLPIVGNRTWRQAFARLLGAVGNEKGMVTFLFVIISIVAVFMVSTTFWTLVQNKTRDIGVMRAIGASRAGILSLFLGYGLAIGVVGAAAGFALAWGIVTYLNEIQEFIAAYFGWRMWDPQIYAFDRIPSRIDMHETLPIVFGAVLSSVLGALIAALRAAALDPIEALRYE